VGEHGDPAGNTFIERYGGVSALLAAIAAGIYVLGLVSLLVPIMATYSKDFTAAWYAVSLVPNTTVAGQGVKQLVFGPLTYLLLASLLVLAIRYVRKNRRQLLASLIVLLVFLYITFPMWQLMYDVVTTELTGGEYEGGESPITGPVLWELIRNRISVSFVVSVAFSIIPALVGVPVGLAIADAIEDTSLQESLTRITRRRAVKRPILWGLGVAFFAAFLIASFRDPPLPAVEIEWWQNQEQTGRGDLLTQAQEEQTTKGDLLTHADSFWYVYRRETKDLIARDEERGRYWLDLRGLSYLTMEDAHHAPPATR
jgi:MFS family permease